MSTKSNNTFNNPKILEFYSDRVKKFGTTPEGVGWRDQLAQTVRFQQLAKVLTRRAGFTINDFGCGTGSLLDFLRNEEFVPLKYSGYDLIPEMIEQASARADDAHMVHWQKINDAQEMRQADYTLVSGTFNVKCDAETGAWTEHVLNTLNIVNEKSKHGFAFNLLTKYSDAEKMQDYLYYGDPLLMFDYCKTKFSKNVALLHDYFLYDFTIVVRKD